MLDLERIFIGKYVILETGESSFSFRIEDVRMYGTPIKQTIEVKAPDSQWFDIKYIVQWHDNSQVFKVRAYDYSTHSKE